MRRVLAVGVTGINVLVAVCVLGALGGCSFRRPFQERTAAVAAVTGREVSGTLLLDFMRARSGFIIHSVKTISPPAGDGQATALPTSVSFMFAGTAAAIDRRGYYLTAAHVISTTPVAVVTHDGRMLEARVVWRGDPAVADIALLRVPTRVDHVFEWAPGMTSGEQVIGGGPTRSLSGEWVGLSMQLETYGGSVRRIFQDRAAPVELTIRSSTPLLSGDSGGPLVNANGQLLGITARSDLTVHLFEVWKLGRKDYVGEAERPDLVWLRTLIADDARTNPQ